MSTEKENLLGRIFGDPNAKTEGMEQIDPAELAGYHRAWEQAGNYKFPVPAAEAGWKKLEQRIGKESGFRLRSQRNFRIMAIAASFLLLAGIAFVLTRSASDNIPAGISSLTSKPKTITMTTLADGTHIWLESGSSIEYQLTEDGKREVKLKGECYFEVAKDQEHPFVVKGSDFSVQVTGTHFTALSGTAGYGKVECYEGSVTVSSAGQENQLTRGLKVLLIGGKQEKSEFDASIDGSNKILGQTLSFDRTPLSEVVRQIEASYAVHIVYDEKLSGKSFTGTFQDKPLEDILKVLSEVFGSEFRVAEPTK